MAKRRTSQRINTRSREMSRVVLPKERITEEAKKVVLPEDTLPEKPQPKPHKVEAGMVEVSLALAALVSAVIALGRDKIPPHPSSLIITAVLIIIANFIGLWFLAAYCVQEHIVKVDKPNEAMYQPSVVWDLITQRTGIYKFLAICQILLTTFAIVLLSADV